jgi:hypothetical protein
MCNVDLSIFKAFAISDRYKLQFRAEAFNLNNTAIFDTPGTAINSANFGVVTATRKGPRELQFALNLSF